MKQKNLENLELPHSPSEAFISAAEEAANKEGGEDLTALREEVERLKAELKKNTRERRSIHFQVLTTPSISQALKEEAAARGVSVNEIVNSLLEAHLFPEEQQ